MAAPRAGVMGVAFVKGDLYIVDEDLNLNRVPVGNDDEVLVADSATALGVAWKDVAATVKASIAADAIDAIYKNVDLGGGAIDNPVPVVRGTHGLLEFDPDALEGLPWQLYMPVNYTALTDVEIHIFWVANGVDTGEALWGAALERDNSGFDIDSDGFGTLVAALGAGPGVAGEIVETVITLSGAAELDGILAGEPFRLFVQRNGADGTDDLTDAAQILRVVVEEA